MRMSYAALIAQTTHSSLMAKPTACARPSAASPKSERSGHKRHVDHKAEEAAVDALPSYPGRRRYSAWSCRTHRVSTMAKEHEGYARCGLTEMEALSIARESASLRRKQAPHRRPQFSHFLPCRAGGSTVATCRGNPPSTHTPTPDPPGMIPASIPSPASERGFDQPLLGRLTPPIIAILSMPSGPGLGCCARLVC